MRVTKAVSILAMAGLCACATHQSDLGNDGTQDNGDLATSEVNCANDPNPVGCRLEALVEGSNAFVL